MDMGGQPRQVAERMESGEGKGGSKGGGVEGGRGDSVGSWMAQLGKETTQFRSRWRKQLTSQHEIRFCATQISIAVRFSSIVVPWYATTRTSWANAR